MRWSWQCHPYALADAVDLTLQMVFGEIWHVHCRPLVILQKCYGEIWHAHFRTFPTGPTSEFRHGKNSSPHRQTIPVVPAPRDRQEWDFRYFQILVKRSREPTSATKDHQLKKAKSFKSTCNSSFVNVNYWVRRHKQEKPTNPNAVT